MLTKLRWREEHSENFNKELENIKKNQSWRIIDMKNILEVIICRLSDMEEHISNLEDRIVEITQSKDKRKKFKKNED